MSVSCECCVLAGGGLCDGPIARPEESYRVCLVCLECDREASKLRRPRPTRAVEPLQKYLHSWAIMKGIHIAFLIVHCTSQYTSFSRLR